MKKKVVSLLICSALMMVEGITTYAQTLSVNPTDSNKATVESPSESKDQIKEKETSELASINFWELFMDLSIYNDNSTFYSQLFDIG